MRLPLPLTEGRLVQRYKRFLADVELADGTIVTAHCPNPGSMTGLKAPGSRVWLSTSPNPKRKLAQTLELVEADGVLVGINTNNPNTLVAEAIAAGTIPELAGYETLRREVRYGVNSRIDILLESEDRPRCYVEVKNVHLLREPLLSEFPDSVTTRGAKHLRELSDMVAAGHRAVMMFLIQRPDTDRISLARDIDPAYGLAFDAAIAAGVEALAWRCEVGLEEITVTAPVPVLDLAPTTA
ncbi:DNA/RNA nuclease SfsA [Rhodobium gokarnense]|uniref:Sugar fermentation stimulation protein homolog n=1 Tax=Rhodobium gokarnense TaxID=364296 RepID=A0ABT3HDF8_9HYPH|nr:DNA/RNA nuclease SfsA [Rhodobium gokarnense]MCW2308413.1 sugar fermentation stimulation protein A [Rhodobium gokarnense]